MAQASPADATAARALQNRALKHLRSGHSADAARAADEALLQMQGGSDQLGAISFLAEMAAGSVELMQYPEAGAYAERALALADASSLPDGDPARLSILETLQDAHIAVGRFSDAHRAGERALSAAIAAHGRNSIAAGRASQRLGVVLARIGDKAAARAMFLQARDTLLATAEPDRLEARDALATTLGNLASTYQHPDEIATAQALYDEARLLRRQLSSDEHPEIAQWHSNLGLLLSEAGDDGLALQSCEQSLALRRRLLSAVHPDIARSLIEVGWLRLRVGDTDGATDALLEALLVLTFFEMPTIEARAHFLVASLLATRGGQAASILLQKICVNALQFLRGRSGSHEQAFVQAREDIYRHLAANLIAAGRLPEALQVVTMLKEFELDAVTNGVLKPVTEAALTPLEHKHLDREHAMRADLKKAATQVASITAIAWQGIAAEGVAALRAWLEQLLQELSATDLASVEPDKPTSQPVSTQVAANVVRLQYLLFQDRVQIVVSSAHGLRQCESRFPAGEVHRRILALRASIADRSSSYLRHARALHDLLLEPVERELADRGIDHLIVSLDGVLRYLPFGVLHDGDTHLIERFAITLGSTAARVGAGMTFSPASARRAAGFGVTRSLGAHRPLHGVREELTAVIGAVDATGGIAHGIVPGSICLDEAFTADALQAVLSGSNAIVHIASHFVFRPAQEDASYLLLGDGGRLTLADLAALRFGGVELLVLSACDTATGGGHRQSGSEFEGLGALARSRGAQHVLATLWPIRDFTSAALMRAFYRRRFRDGLAPAAALRQAQLELLHEASRIASPGGVRGLRDPEGDAESPNRPARLAHPYYWAPYVLVA